MAWQDDKSAGDQIPAADWNALKDAVLSGSGLLSSGSKVSNNIFSPFYGFYTDDPNFAFYYTGTTVRTFFGGANWESRNTTSDWASATAVVGAVKIEDYLYLHLIDSSPVTHKVYRYDADDIASGGTEMTGFSFGSSATPTDVRMTSDGTDLFFTWDAGADATNDYEVRRVSISGTTLTSEETITCGGTAGYFDQFAVDSTYIYAVNSSSPYYVRKYDRATGTLQATTSAGIGAMYLFGVMSNVFLYHATEEAILPVPL